MRIAKSVVTAVLPGLLIAGGAFALFGQAGAQIATPPSLAPPAQNDAIPAVPLAGPGGAPRSFADLTAKLTPAVVNISTTQKVEVGRNLRNFGQGGQANPLEEFFRRFQEQQGEQGEPVTREATSLGSGFIVDPSGYVVTNNHVISGGGDPRSGAAPGNVSVDTITVTLSDRREYKARVVGRDTLSDLALLKIEATNLPYVKFGNSQGVRVGDWAIAIGNPFSLGGTVTAGIVSALHRNIGSGQYDRYIQTDASINQGNSGGPLFDLDGNVIGINTAIFSPTGGNVGLGFAIPAELAQPVITQLRAGGLVRRGYLGVSIQPVSSDIAAGLGLPKDRGEIVAAVVDTGPAARAGVKQGDVIVKVANQEVTFDNTLSFIVANQRIGSTIPIELIRGGKRMTVNTVVAPRPSEAIVQGIPETSEQSAQATPPASDATRASLGLSLLPAITPEVRSQLKLSPTVQGVVVAAVSPSSDAASKGFQRGDLILQINQMPTPTPAAAAAAVAAARKAGKETVLVLVQRGQTPALYRGIDLQADKKG